VAGSFLQNVSRNLLPLSRRCNRSGLGNKKFNLPDVPTPIGLVIIGERAFKPRSLEISSKSHSDREVI
jgi:hypothetical protein